MYNQPTLQNGIASVGRVRLQSGGALTQDFGISSSDASTWANQGEIPWQIRRAQSQGWVFPNLQQPTFGVEHTLTAYNPLRMAEQQSAAPPPAAPSSSARPASASLPPPSSSFQPTSLPAARPLFPGGSGVPQTPGYVPPAYDVSASPYVSAGQGFSTTMPQVGGAYDDAVSRAQQYFSAMQPGGELIDPADAVMVPPMPTQWRSQEERSLYAEGGSPRMDLPYNSGQLPQTPVGPRINGPVLGPGTDTSDNIAAALSPNEFVFTAPAVRAAGGGDVNRGIQAMYDLMHSLERRA